MRLSLGDPIFLTILLIAVSLFAVALIGVAVFLVLRSRKDKEAKKEQKPDSAGQSHPVADPGMAASFREAMKRLRERLPGWGYRYSVPWYALVGESGSGKTAVADSVSGGSAEVVGPIEVEYAPRWLLLDQAVLIDLPGHSFLATESVTRTATDVAGKSSSDHEAWKGFLRMLARYRPRQPLNGIVLTISAIDLLAASDDPDQPRQLAKIAALSQRLDEIQHYLRLSLPVYVLVTKCDAVNGFDTYSRALFEEAPNDRNGNNGHSAVPTGTVEMTENLFGWSSPYLLETSYSAGWVDEAFDETHEVLLQRQLEMLAQSRSAASADGVLQFPFELQRLRAPLRGALNRVFKTTAYHAPHVLRGIYFCGREEERDGGEFSSTHVNQSLSPAPLSRAFPLRTSNSVLYVRHLFQFKIFAERYLATPIGSGFLSGNRSVLAAQIAGGLLGIFLLIASIQAWTRLGRLQQSRLEPALQSMASSLDEIAVSSNTNVSFAVDVFNQLGVAREHEYYSWAMPYSYLDLGGLHRDLRETLESTFEVAILRSCKFALEGRIAEVMSASPITGPPTSQITSEYPPGSAWTTDPAYRELDRYLSDLRDLEKNIDRYQLISSAGSGSFHQLNALLMYLGGRNLPDTGRLAQDADYKKLLLHATWEPLRIPAKLDPLTAAATRRRTDNFFESWFVGNPLVGEVRWIAGADGLASLSASGPALSNLKLHALISRTQGLENQLQSGSYDWLAAEFDRKRYPALGPKLDQIPFAESEFVGEIAKEGAERQAALRDTLTTVPAVLDFEEDKVRLAGPVATLASALDALLGYELMSDAYEAPATGGCHLIPSGTVWNSDALTRAIDLETMRGKIEAELLPALPGEYREAVQRLVDRRAETALASVLQIAAVPNPALGDAQAALQTELQALSRSMDKLNQIEAALSETRTTAEATCLNRSLAREANSLLARINEQLPALYAHAGVSGSSTGELPVSLWLYGVASTEDLQAYLGTEHQLIEALSAEAAPLVQYLRAAGGHSEVLGRWHNIHEDVAAFQAQKPGNPIQTLESYIATDLDKVTPEANCNSPSPARSVDVFLNVRAQLAALAVRYCRQVAVNRFNRIAVDFNQKLAGYFPFSKFEDTRSGVEADPAEIAAFYKSFDAASAGLGSVLPGAVQKPEEVATFLQAITAARPLVTGTAKDLIPALGLSIRFRTNRNHESFGNRIAEWDMRVGQEALQSPLGGDQPPAIWHYGDPIALSVRYANNSPEVPAPANPSAAAVVQGRTVTYQYSHSWSLFALLRDHPPGAADPRNQYAVEIPNVAGASGAHLDTVVYIQIDPLPVGAKPGGETLPVPVFPYQAPIARLKTVSGE